MEPPVAERPAPAPTAPLHRPRVDLFALPTATSSFFVLLIALTLGSAALIYDYLVGGNFGWIDSYRACRTVAQLGAGTLDPQRVAEDYLSCTTSVDRFRVVPALLGVAGVVAIVVVAHLLAPRLIERRQRLRPLTDPDALRLLDRLRVESGVRRPPAWLVDPFRSALGGRAFGRFPRYRIKLTLGTVRALRDGSAAARGIVRHELAHLRNGDLDLTGLAIVAGWVYTLAVALPALVMAALRSTTGLWSLVWRLAAIVGVLVLVRAALLRSRELDADVRASVANLAAGEPGFDPSAFPEHAPARHLNPFRRHPRTADRHQIVHRPDLLLRSGFALPFAAGLTGAITIGQAEGPFVNLLGGNHLHGRMLAATVIGGIVASVVASSLWRDTLRALLLRTPLPRGAGSALGLTSGLLVGGVLSPQQDMSAVTLALSRDPLLAAAAFAIMALFALLFARWTVGSAAAWLSVAAGERLGPVLWAGRLAAAVAFGAAFGLWSQAVASAANYDLLFAHLRNSLTDLLILVVAVVAAAFPLVSRLRAERGRPRWWFLDPAGEPVQLPAPRLRPLWVTVPPIIVLIALLVLDRLAPFGWLLWVGQEFGPNATDILIALGALNAGLLAMVMVVVGVAAGNRDGAGLAPAHALVAGVLTGTAVPTALLWTRPAELCQATALCAPVGLAGIVGVVMLAETILVMLVAVVVCPLAGLINGIRALADRGPRWPAGDNLAAARPSLRPWLRTIGRVMCVLAAIAFVVPTVAGSLALQGRVVGMTPTPVPDPASPRIAGTVPLVDVCTAMSTYNTRPQFAALTDERRHEIGALAAGADDPGAAAIGIALYRTAISGNSPQTTRNYDTLGRYCTYLG